MRRVLSALVLAAAVASSGCRPQVKPDADRKPKCYELFHGKPTYFGTEACLKERKSEVLVGYWLLGYEASIFYTNRATASKANFDGYWLDASDENSSERNRLSNPQFQRIYKVTLIGHRSDEPGIYGPGLGNLRGGILADRILSATLVSEKRTTLN